MGPRHMFLPGLLLGCFLGACADNAGRDAEREAVAHLGKVAGMVRAYSPADGAWRDVSRGQGLAARETLRTADSARAVVELSEDSRLDVGPNSTLTIRPRTVEVQSGSVAVDLSGNAGTDIQLGGDRVLHAAPRPVVVLGAERPFPTVLALAFGAPEETRERMRDQAMIEYTRSLLDTWKTSDGADLVWIAKADRYLKRAEQLAQSGQRVDVATPCDQAWRVMAEQQRAMAKTGAARIEIHRSADGREIITNPGGSAVVITGPDGQMTKLEGGQAQISDGNGKVQVVAMPGAPEPADPPDGWTVYNLEDGPGQVLAWKARPGHTYRLQVAGRPEFDEQLHTDQERVTTAGWPVKDLGKGNWYWRVQAVDPRGVTSRWSPTRRFEVAEDHEAPPLEIDPPVWK